MSKSSRRRTQQAKRAALSHVARDIQSHAPSAIPPALVAQITSQITQYSGPVPPPELLGKYDDVIPNGAERIMVMAEQQLAHRIDLERTVVHGDARRSWFGLWLGFIVSLVIIAAGVTVALMKSPTSGAVIITGTIVTLASVFVYATQSRRAEREHKAELMAGRRS